MEENPENPENKAQGSQDGQQFGGLPNEEPPNGQRPQYGQESRYGEVPQYGQPQYGQPQYGQPQYGQDPYNFPAGSYKPVLMSEKTNTLAVVSLVSAFFISVVGIVTGHIALSQIKRTGEKGKGLAIGGLVIGYISVLIAIIATIALIVGGIAAVNSFPTKTSGNPISDSTTSSVPQNSNAFGGIAFGKNSTVIRPVGTPATVDLEDLTGKAEGDEPAMKAIGISVSAAGKPVQVVIYLDFMCPACSNFHKQNSSQLKQWQDAGKITIEYRPISNLDQLSMGTKYSTRAANAAACVADNSPENYEAYVDELYKDQPDENSSGLNNAVLSVMAVTVGATGVSSCINDQSYANYVAYSTQLIIDHGLRGTPTVYVDGKQWKDGTFAKFATPIVDAKK